MKEVITDEKITEKTRVGEVCSDSCIPERHYHLNHIGVGTEDIDEPYRTLLLEAEANKAELEMLREDIKFRDIDCGCNARITELRDKLKVAEEALIALKRADDETNTIEDYVEFQNRRMCAFEVCDIALKKLKAE